MPFDLNALEDVVLDNPANTRPVMPVAIIEPDPEFNIEGDLEEEADEPKQVVLMSHGMWMEQWAFLHDMGGGMIQARTGAPCPIGDQARSEGGRAAGEAAYQIISKQPALAKLFLSEESTFLGQLAAIGMHGAACVQIVKASARRETLPSAKPEAEQ